MCLAFDNGVFKLMGFCISEVWPSMALDFMRIFVLVFFFTLKLKPSDLVL